MESKVLIITGANRGLGKAIIDLALQEVNTLIISISRSIHEDHKVFGKDKFIFIEKDLSTPFSNEIIDEINKYITKDSSIYFFNNASIVLPIKKIGDLTENEVDSTISVNVNYPSKFINSIIHFFSKNKLTIINISSGAASRAISHWSLYCASKAFMSMYLQVLLEENKENENLFLHNINPGVIDTGMQQNIRDNSFPDQSRFISLKDENKLLKPEEAALSILNEINYYI